MHADTLFAEPERPLAGRAPGTVVHASVDEALAIIASVVRPVAGRERVPLAQAHGRVLALDCHAPLDLPPHDNAAMDGFALRAADVAADGSGTWPRLPCVLLAGDDAGVAVPPGHCVRIMTGAAMPPGLDTVVPVERCVDDGAFVRCTPGQAVPGAHCRRRGEDMARGAVAVPAGRRLRAAELGLLASLSFAQVEVLRRPRIALLSCGDELRQPGQPLAPGCIYDSNRHALRAALEAVGMAVVDLGCIADDVLALREALLNGVARADAVLTSASASAGDADHLVEALSAIGHLRLQGVRMRPGKPFCFGGIDVAGASVPLFGLPGNPVAALVSLQVLGAQALATLAGDRFFEPRLCRVRLKTGVAKRTGRTEFPRARLSQAADGCLEAEPHPDQGAAVLASLVASDALLVLPEAAPPLKAGDWVTARLLPTG